MISFKFGNILDSHANIIVQQVNCQGFMGTEFGTKLKQAFPTLFTSYREFCDRHIYKEKLLGKMHLCWCESRDKKYKCYIANLFGQFGIDSDTKQTDYKALENAMKLLEVEASRRLSRVAIPYGIGCGSSGGDWKMVSNIIFNVFTGSDAEIEIWREEPPKPIEC